MNAFSVAPLVNEASFDSLSADALHNHQIEGVGHVHPESIASKENVSYASHPNHEHNHTNNSAKPLLSVADFDGNGVVEELDINDIALRDRSFQGDEKYHPLYDLDADGKIDGHDISMAVNTLGQEVPLLDQQIAQATQATMPYYGPHGLENAIKDGFLPFTQEANGHGIHYYNPNLALQVGNYSELDIKRPVGLNYDAKGNLLAVFYLRLPKTGTPTPENPLAGLSVDPSDDSPSQISFDTLSKDDWHHHHNAWITGVGNLNAESVYFEEDVPLNLTVPRLEQEQFKLFPESDKYYSPKFWMLHGWFHSLNPDGTFANTNSNVSQYAPEELGDHGHRVHTPLLLGTDGADQLDAGDQVENTHEGVRINGFQGDDLITGHHADDVIWGGYGNDLLLGDRNTLLHSSHEHESEMLSSSTHLHDDGNDMLYGGPGDDLIYGQGGQDRIFGGVGKDLIWGSSGDDLLRGGFDADLLIGDDFFNHTYGKDSFVLAPGEGTDKILDFQVGSDMLVLEGGLTLESLSITQITRNVLMEFGSESQSKAFSSLSLHKLCSDNNTLIEFGDQSLAILMGVNATDLMAANSFTVA